MLDLFHTEFETKNLPKIQKSLDLLEEQSSSTSSSIFINFTEAQLFPKDFREHFIKKSRLVFNSFLANQSFGKSYFYKSIRDRAIYNYVTPMLSTQIEPAIYTEFEYINFYQSIMDEFIVTMLKYVDSSRIERTDRSITIYLKNSNNIFVSFTTQSIKFGFYSTSQETSSELIRAFASEIDRILAVAVHRLIDSLYSKYLENKPVIVLKYGLFHKEKGGLVYLKFSFFFSEDFENVLLGKIKFINNLDIRIESQEYLQNTLKHIESFFRREEDLRELRIKEGSFFKVLSEVWNKIPRTFFYVNSENAVFTKKLPGEIIKDFGSFSPDDLQELFALHELNNLTYAQKHAIKNFFKEGV
jgi:hypothetical protein